MSDLKIKKYEREKKKIQKDDSLTFEQHEKKIKELAKKLGV